MDNETLVSWHTLVVLELQHSVGINSCCCHVTSHRSALGDGDGAVLNYCGTEAEDEQSRHATLPVLHILGIVD